MCHSFFNRLSKKYNITLDRSQENQALVNSYIGAITEADAERKLENMSDEKIYEIYIKLFKKKKERQQVEAYV